MTLITVKSMWNDYRKYCVSSEAGPVQLKETRMAFYAGFMCMMEVNKAIGEPEVSEKVACTYLKALDKELSDFRDTLKGKSKCPN